VSDKRAFQLFRWIPLLILIILVALIYHFQWHEYLTFDSLSKHHKQLELWTQQHYSTVVLIFIFTYIFVVATSIPGGAMTLTVSGGFLFGIIPAALYVVLAATLGASILFMIVKTALGSWLSQKAKGWVKRLEEGFKHNAFNYLLFLRLLPLFPFWVVNIVPALLNVKLRDFFFATLLGIIPGTLVYASVGNGLEHVFEKGEALNLSLIFDPEIFIPILILAILSIVPIAYKKLKARKNG